MDMAQLVKEFQLSDGRWCAENLHGMVISPTYKTRENLRRFLKRYDLVVTKDLSANFAWQGENQ
jgi:hypothetical protein